MLPTFKKSDRVLTQNWFYKLNLKDIVVAKVNSNLIIKRIKKISQDKFYLVGDNEKMSTDSRTFGEVDKDQIIGKVVFVGR